MIGNQKVPSAFCLTFYLSDSFTEGTFARCFFMPILERIIPLWKRFDKGVPFFLEKVMKCRTKPLIGTNKVLLKDKAHQSMGQRMSF